MSENKINFSNNITENEEIYLLEIQSFEELYDLLKKRKYSSRKLEKDFQNFCLESKKIIIF